MTTTRNKRLAALCCYLIVLLPKLLMILHALPLRTISDETATISGAAYLAGYDWSAVVSHAGYYGQGFYSLFFWVFLLTDNPVIIFRTILALCAVLQSLLVFLVFDLADRDFEIRSIPAIMAVSVFAGYMPTSRILFLFNENMLNLLCWLIIYAVFRAARATSMRNRTLWSVLVALLLCWSMTMHLRMKILMIAMAMSVALAGVLYVLGKREKHKSDEVEKNARKAGMSSVVSVKTLAPAIAVVCAVFACCYKLAQVFIARMQAALWITDTGANLRNGSTNLKIKVDVFTKDYVKTILNSVFGQVTTYTMFTGCTFLLALLLLVRWYLVYRRSSSKIVTPMLITGLAFLLAAGGMTAAQAIRWGNDVYPALAALRTDMVYSYKSFTYIRYLGIFAGPLTVLGMMCGLQLWEVRVEPASSDPDTKVWKTTAGVERSGRLTFHREVVAYCAILIFLLAYWFRMIQPFIEYNLFGREPFLTFMWLYQAIGERISLYRIGIGFLILFSVVQMILVWKRRLPAVLILATLLLMASYVFGAKYWDYMDQYTNAMTVEQTVEDLKANEAEILEGQHADPVKDHPVIYYLDHSGMTDHNTYYLLQFWLPRWTIIPLTDEDPIPQGEGVVIVSSDGGYGAAYGS